METISSSISSVISVTSGTEASVKSRTKKASGTLKVRKDISLTAAESLAFEMRIYKRNHLDWIEREEGIILDKVMEMGSLVTVFGLAAKFGRDPVLVALHILEGDLPEMCGFEAPIGSQEEAEFMGLVLGGTPVSLALRWCSATPEQEDRPTSLEVDVSLVYGDMRPAMNRVRELGVWMTAHKQLEYAQMLLDFDISDEHKAVAFLVDRAQALSPELVFQQLCGALEEERPVDWAQVRRCAEASGNSPSSPRPGMKRKGAAGRNMARTARKKSSKDPWSIEPKFNYRKSTKKTKSAGRYKKKYASSASWQSN